MMAARKNASISKKAAPAPSGFELELNDLRSELARALNTSAAPVTLVDLAERLKLLEARVSGTEPATQEDVSERIREHILRALATADNGKPGFLSFVEIGEKCGLDKPAVHWHTNELEKRGKIWIRKTHDAKTGRPHFRAYHPSAVRMS